jgi:hypothetical protein
MRERNASVDWNLLLIGSSPKGSESILGLLSGGVAACGGWVLSQNRNGHACSEIDFEFPRAKCVEVYSVLVAAGVTLSPEAHVQLTELCQCTKYLIDTRAFHIVRLHLTIFIEAEILYETEVPEEAEVKAA